MYSPFTDITTFHLSFFMRKLKIPKGNPTIFALIQTISTSTEYITVKNTFTFSTSATVFSQLLVFLLITHKTICALQPDQPEPYLAFSVLY